MGLDTNPGFNLVSTYTVILVTRLDQTEEVVVSKSINDSGLLLYMWKPVSIPRPLNFFLLEKRIRVVFKHGLPDFLGCTLTTHSSYRWRETNLDKTQHQETYLKTNLSFT